MSEDGGFYDQPNAYIELMVEMDSAISDSSKIQDDMKKEEDEKVQKLRAMGVNFTPK